MPPTTIERKRKVFVVDDHPLVRESLANLIDQQPDLVMCGEAENSNEAMAGIAAARPDVAIIDISLKDSFGLELIKKLHVSHPRVILLVLSMHDESLYAERVLRSGAMGYVMKQEATKKVIEGIRQVLEGKIYVSENFAQAMATQFVEGKLPVKGSPVHQFTDRELEIFELLGQGYRTTQIAKMLRVSAKTVHAYCARMREKMSLDNSRELLREAFRWNESKG
jgi:DNA-binding NarL/FixJ family response regulator